MQSGSLSSVLLGLAALIVFASSAAASTLPPVLANDALSWSVAAEAAPPVILSFDGLPSILDMSDFLSSSLSQPGDTSGAGALPPESDTGGGPGLTICVLAVLAFGTLIKAVNSTAFRKLLASVYYPESY